MSDDITKPVTRGSLSPMRDKWGGYTGSGEGPGEDPEATAEPDPSLPPVIDEHVQRQLGQSLDAEMIAEVVDAFMADAEPRLAVISDVLAAGDIELLERHYHSIKGAAANLGFHRLVHFCEQARTALKEGRLADLPPLQQAIADAYAATVAAWRARDGTSPAW